MKIRAMTTDLKKFIGLQVRSLRNAKGLTQDQLAEKVKMTVESISNIERGNVLPPLDTLLRVATQLDVPLVQFFDGLEQSVGNRSIANVELEAKVREICRHLSDSDLKLALELIETVAGQRKP